jgi:hypothetical protein
MTDLIALSPKGTKITCTLETVQGTCGVYFEGVNADGKPIFDYDGSGTDVDWNSQETVKRDGKTVFFDENGDEWLEDQITVVDPTETAECQDCEWFGPVDDLNPIKDIGQRVAPGEPMPAGECPRCGALAHTMEEE